MKTQPSYLPDPTFPENGIRVLSARYIEKSGDGQTLLETAGGRIWNVAYELARASAEYVAAPGAAHWVGEATRLAVAAQYYQLMASGDFLPNSPTLMNAGKNNGLQYSACYVLPVEDSMDEIFETVKRAALVHKSGGGTGFAFSRLRPVGDIVGTTGGIASGPVSFMEVFNAATEQVKQGGTRRGANMGILRVDHPDVEDFINCKRYLRGKAKEAYDSAAVGLDNAQQESLKRALLEGQISNFNISIAITDEFMHALEQCGSYSLIHPVTGEQVDSRNAEVIFNLICQAAWETGDPGLVFIDRINKSASNPCPDVYQIESTNPCGEQALEPNGVCFAPETRITTINGLETVKDLYKQQQDGRTVMVATAQLNGLVGELVFRSATVAITGTKDTVRVQLNNGQEICVTPDHRILTMSGWRSACDLTQDDKVCIQPYAGVDFNDVDSTPVSKRDQLYGWFTGDGWFTLAKCGRTSAGLVFGPDDSIAKEQLVPEWLDWTGSKVKAYTQKNGVSCIATERASSIATIEYDGFSPAIAPQKRIPKWVFTASLPRQIGYLQGLFSADGGNSSQRACANLTSASRSLLRDVQLLLLNMGVRSRLQWSDNKDGRSWGRLDINGQSWHVFKNLIGFPLAANKQSGLDKKDWKKIKRDWLYSKVRSVISDAKTVVYDISEPVTESLIAEGMVVHNCNLGSVNLGHYVRYPQHNERLVKAGYDPLAVPLVDWEKLETDVKLATQLMDDVIDVNPFPDDLIRDAAYATRRLGLGVMGWADMLIKLEIPYDSDQAVALAEEVMLHINRAAHAASQALATKRGAFPLFEQSIYASGAPLRNGTLTTVAPTGTISIISGCSSGIEPLFALAFDRKGQLDGKLHAETNAQLKEVAQREGWWTDDLADKIKVHGSVRGIVEVPYKWQRVFATAHDIAPEWHIKMQAAWQKNVDNGISKTINLTHDATAEDIRNAYLLAWRLGCKGITAYRDGCKVGVLHVGTGESNVPVADSSRVKIQIAFSAPREPRHMQTRQRPMILRGQTYSVETPLGTAYITINHDDDGEPFEVFVNQGKAGSDIAPLAEAIGKLTSLCLRLPGEVPPRERLQEMAKRLRGIGGASSIGFGNDRTRSLPDALAKILDAYEAEQQKIDDSFYDDDYVDDGLEEASAPAPIAAPEAFQTQEFCPDCNCVLYAEEGCYKCQSCGYSRC